jgi:DNA-directed RNA polymerase subunit RPC12/RpoP
MDFSRIMPYCRIDRLHYPTTIVSARYAPPACPKCGSRAIVRSRRRTAVDRLISHFRGLPYRCRDCHNRFWPAMTELETEAQVLVPRSSNSKRPRRCRRSRVIGIVYGCALAACALLAIVLTYEQ